MMMKDCGNIDWDAVRGEYLAGGIGQRKLAQKWGVGFSALRRRAVSEGWAAEKGGRDPSVSPAGCHLPSAEGRQGGRRNAAPKGNGEGEAGSEKTSSVSACGAATFPKEEGKETTSPAPAGHPPLKGRAFGEAGSGEGEAGSERTSSVSACGAATFPKGEGKGVPAGEGEGEAGSERTSSVSACGAATFPKGEGKETTSPAPAGHPPLKGRAFGEAGSGDDEADIALRLRRKLLKRLERMADEIPDGAVTEYKTQDDSAVKLFKLRDLTAAYKELAGDLPEAEQDGVKVVVDV